MHRYTNEELVAACAEKRYFNQRLQDIAANVHLTDLDEYSRNMFQSIARTGVWQFRDEHVAYEIFEKYDQLTGGRDARTTHIRLNCIEQLVHQCRINGSDFISECEKIRGKKLTLLHIRKLLQLTRNVNLIRATGDFSIGRRGAIAFDPVGRVAKPFDRIQPGEYESYSLNDNECFFANLLFCTVEECQRDPECDLEGELMGYYETIDHNDVVNALKGVTREAVVQWTAYDVRDFVRKCCRTELDIKVYMSGLDLLGYNGGIVNDYGRADRRLLHCLSMLLRALPNDGYQEFHAIYEGRFLSMYKNYILQTDNDSVFYALYDVVNRYDDFDPSIETPLDRCLDQLFQLNDHYNEIDGTFHGTEQDYRHLRIQRQYAVAHMILEHLGELPEFRGLEVNPPPQHVGEPLLESMDISMTCQRCACPL